MATQETIEEIIKLAGEITQREVRDVVRNNDKWGEVNFDDCRDDLEAAYTVISPLLDLSLGPLLEPQAIGISNHLEALRKAIEDVTKFTIKQTDHEQIRTQLAQQLTATAQAVWGQIAPWIGYLFFQAGDVSEGLKKIANSRGQVDDALADFLTNAIDGQTQIANAVAAAKEVAGKAGVGHFNEDFANEAKDQGDAAWWWLGATAVFAVLTAVSAYVFGTTTEVPETIPALLQFAAMRVVILGLLFTSTLWCGHMYKTNKHQQSINKHRANALQTFQAFVEASNDPAVRDAVLMETTRSIFAITSTGYLGVSDNSPDAGSKVVEIIKAIPKGAVEG